MNTLFLTDEERQNHREWLRNYINEYCIVRVPPDKTPMYGKAPGSRYTWQFYLRRGLFNHRFNYRMALLFLDMIQTEYNYFDFQISGLETASTPMISVIPLIASNYNIDINAFSIRKERKNYGMFNLIEGTVRKGVPVLLMDDLSNSTSSLQRAFYVVTNELKETPFPATFTVVNKTRDNSSDKSVPEFLKNLSLFNLTDFNLSYDSYIQSKAEKENKK